MNPRVALAANVTAHWGEIVTNAGIAHTEALANFDESPTDRAVMVIFTSFGTDAGAVYQPLLVINPQSGIAQVTLQFTAVLPVFITVDVNCCVWDEPNQTSFGETETHMVVAVIACISLFKDVLEVPAQPMMTTNAKHETKPAIKLM